MSTTLTLLIVASTISLTLTGVGLFVAFAWRKHQEGEQRAILASRFFNGWPHAAVTTTEWRLSPEEIRLVANQRGYVDAPSHGPAILAFRYDPAAVASDVEHRFELQPTRKQSRARETLSKELAAKEFVWTEPSEIGGTTTDVAAIASRHGAAILRTYGDRNNPMLLLGKRPIQNVREIVPLGKRQALASVQRLWLARGTALAGLLMVFVAFAATDQFRQMNLLGWVALTVALAAIPVATAIELAPALSSSATRMNRLVREFNGRAKVTLIANQYRFDQLAYLDIAAEFGYQHVKSMSAWRTSSRWNEAWLTFMLRPGFHGGQGVMGSPQPYPSTHPYSQPWHGGS